jgi:hypothetical protein
LPFRKRRFVILGAVITLHLYIYAFLSVIVSLGISISHRCALCLDHLPLCTLPPLISDVARRMDRLLSLPVYSAISSAIDVAPFTVPSPCPLRKIRYYFSMLSLFQVVYRTSTGHGGLKWGPDASQSLQQHQPIGNHLFAFTFLHRTNQQHPGQLSVIVYSVSKCVFNAQLCDCHLAFGISICRCLSLPRTARCLASLRRRI